MKSQLATAILFTLLAAGRLAGQVDNPGQTPMKAPAPILQQHVDNPGQTPPAAVGPTAPQSGPTGAAVVTGNGISTQGGPVLKGNPVPFYLIWYGNWNGTGSNTMTTVSLVEHFVQTLGGTPYENIGTTYGDASGNVSGNVSLGGAIFVNSSTNLTDSGVQTAVKNALTSGALPTNAGGVYFVISSSNISETSGFCTSYCGFHTHAILNGVDIKYAFIGNPDRCPSACEVQRTGPNSPSAGSGGADGIVFTFASKQFDAITDPDQNAWFDGSGVEAGDKCAGMLGPLATCVAGSACTSAGISAGAKYNVCFGGLCWLLPELWENSNGGKCVLHL